MNKFTYVIILLLLTCFSINAQINIQNLSNKEKAEKYLSTKGELTFSFKVENTREIEYYTKDLSIVNFDSKTNTVVAWANENQFRVFEAKNIAFEVPVSKNEVDEVLIYDNQSEGARGITANTLTFPVANYPTYAQYAQQMQDFETDNPTLVEKISIGFTTEGDKELLFVKISDNIGTNEQEPKLMLTSSMHGDEIAGYPMMLSLIDYILTVYADTGHSDHARVKNLVENAEIWINPSANPDGTYYNSTPANTFVTNARRANINGWDLNRNYPDNVDGPHPDGNSIYELETQHFMALADANQFVISANFHGGTELVNYPFDNAYASTTAYHSEDPSGNGPYYTHPDGDWFEFISIEYATHAQTDSPGGYMTVDDDSYIYPSPGVTHGAEWYRVYGGRQDYMNFYQQCREVTVELSDTKIIPESSLVDHWLYNRDALLDFLTQGTYGFTGLVKDSSTGNPIEATVTIVGHDNYGSHTTSGLSHGDYYRPIKGGGDVNPNTTSDNANTATYDILFEAPCYQSFTLTNQSIANNQRVLLPDVSLTPGAAIPSSIAPSNVFATSATVSWDAQSGNTFDLRYKETGSPTWTDVTGLASNTYNITGLLISTEYEVQVSSKCNTFTSNYSSSIVFLTPSVSYCSSSGNVTNNTGVTYVSFNTITKSDTDKDVGYEDFTSETTNVVKGDSHNLTVRVNTDGNRTVHAFAWFDWNGDGDFDDTGETVDMGNVKKVADGATSLSPVSVTIPASANFGTTIMRISAKFNSDPSSCETNFDGEVEDYSINIVPPSAPPTAICQDITVQLDETGSVTILPSDVDGGSSGDGTITLSLDIDTFTCSDIGDNIVTLTVTDPANPPAATCNATVTITQQSEPPIVNCWDNFVYNSTTCLWENTGTAPTPVVTNVTICSDETYTWSVNSVTYDGSDGDTSVTVPDTGCGPDQTLNITVTPEPTPVVTNVTICSDETYTWAENSVTYNGSAGTQSVTIEGDNCAADQTLNITVTLEPTPVVTDVTICSDETYTWSENSVTYNGSAGTQSVTIEGDNCAADQTLNITVTPEPTPVVTNVTICSDETYTWSENSVTYNGSAGNQSVTIEGDNCAADQTLNITVTPEPTPVVTDVTICSDETYTWAENSVTYNGSAGTQSIFIEGDNCAADQTLNITVTPEPTPVVTNVTICSDETYTWAENSVTYNGSMGPQSITIEGDNCAADQTLNITVTLEPTPVVTNVTICSDETYTWSENSVTYNGSAGTQSVTIEGDNCEADQTLNITVTPEPTPVVTNVTICSDETYTWAENSVTYNGSAGTQSVFIEGDNCAADQTLNITVTPEPTPVVTNVTICSDETYTWAENSTTYNGSAGTQSIFIEGDNCAADQTLNITVTLEPTPVVTNITICSDETYTWAENSVTYNGSTGPQSVTIEGDNCAADQTLNITVTLEPTPVVTNVTICSDESYAWAENSVTYNGSAGTQSVTIEGDNCAADQTLNITVTPEPTPVVTNVTICSDETYTWSENSVTYNGSAGNQSVTIEGDNCAADQTLNITVTPEPTPVVTDVTICSDETYTWAENSVTYNGSAGTQSIFIEGDNCAADQTLNITVTPEPTPVVTNVTICSDETYTWAENSVTYNGSAGNQSVTIEGDNCAADQTLNITVTLEPTPVVTNVTICSDETYTWSENSVTYNGSAGTQSVTIEGDNCAADQTLNITVTPEPTPVVTNVTICSDETYTWAENSVTYNGSAGTQSVFIEGDNCAADQTLNITVTPEPTPVVTDVTICSDETYTWAENSVTYNGSAGTQSIFIEGDNCAADQTLNITVTPEPTPVVTNVTICSDETYTWAENSVTYNGSTGPQSITIEGDNCAADQTLNITVTLEPTPVVTNVTICSDETYTWSENSVTYNGSAGTQSVTIEGDNCEADQTLNITVTPEPTPVVTDVTICSNETYTWSENSVTYNGSAGPQSVTIEGDNCAADQTLNITVTPATNIFYADTDDDGYGDPDNSILSCTQPIGFETDNTDCDDTNNTIYPGAPEITDDGIDQDCDGIDQSALGVDDFNLDNINIYPNPFKDNLNIKLPVSYSGTTIKIEILDIRGRLIKTLQKEYNNAVLIIKEFSDFEDGSYFIKITNKSSKIIFKQLIKD